MEGPSSFSKLKADGSSIEIVVYASGRNKAIRVVMDID